jgi:hypothetical protein
MWNWIKFILDGLIFFPALQRDQSPKNPEDTSGKAQRLAIVMAVGAISPKQRFHTKP